ncbi:OB-fold domain-containing protein [Paraburkholderia sediminicola]|uniref:Zn-ribbon domain-containing OB-fold protein n=1 Tax=Paraburkholderia sediminicola TaxID=458836 RepID=UPI0038BD0EA9
MATETKRDADTRAGIEHGPIQADYLGMSLRLSELDVENQTYFRYCASHDFRLQRCCGCEQLRYPPMPGCPWCASHESEWVKVDGRGEVHSYTEIYQAIQPGFADRLPYLVAIVELDVQKGQPTAQEGLRVVGNLVDGEGRLAAPAEIGELGIGTRVRLVFTDVADGLSLPQWMIDEEANRSVSRPWRWDASEAADLPEGSSAPVA